MADFVGESFDPSPTFGSESLGLIPGYGFEQCAAHVFPPNPLFMFTDDGSSILQGPITGGTRINVVDLDLSFIDTSCDDSFTGVVIDPTKWTSSSSGSGSVSQNDQITLQTGTTPSSSATLTSVPLFQEFIDFGLTFNIQTDVIGAPPPSPFRFLDVELQINASNYFRISRLFDSSAGHVFRFTTVIGGTTVDDVFVDTDIMAGTLRVVRIAGRLTVYINSSVMYDDNPFSPDVDTSLVIRCVNGSSTVGYGCKTILDNFAVSTLILLGQEPCPIHMLGLSTLKFGSPEARLPGKASLYVYTCEGLVLSAIGAFEYVMSDEFIILNTQEIGIGVLGDTALRNLTTGRVGFTV